MGKEEIVRKLLERGIMVSPEILEEISKTGIDSFLKERSAEDPAVPGRDGKKGERPRCAVCPARPAGELTPDDVIRANTEKFERIRKMLLRKVDAVSISNSGRGNSKLCIVGMVKEKTGNGFIVEDGTGELEVRTGETVELDDVVGVRGWIRDKTLFAEEVVYPDLPMDREPGAINASLLLSSKREDTNGKAGIVLTPSSIISEGKESMLPNPAWVYVEDQGKKMTVLVYRAQGKAGKGEALAWLKKRYLGKDEVPISKKERIIETVPDIFWLVTENEPWTANYKGVSIVSFGKGHNALIDLENRKIEIS